MIDAVLNHLSDNTKGRWLIVIDNADDINLLKSEHTTTEQSLLSRIPQTRNCKVFMTTTNRRVAERFTSRWSEPLEVGLLDTKNAELLLRRRTPHELLQTGNVTELLHALNYLPLAVSQAAGYMRYYGIHVQEYVSYFKEDPQTLLGCSFDLELSTRDRDQPNAVLTTLNITLMRLAQSNPTAAYIVELMSYFAHESIPDFLLLDAMQLTRRELKEAMGALIALSIISKDHNSRSDTRPDRDYESYSFHRVASMVLRILTHPRVVDTLQQESSLAIVPTASSSRNRGTIRDASASILKAWPAGDEEGDLPRKVSLLFHGHAVLRDPLFSSVDGTLRVRLSLLLGSHIIQHHIRGGFGRFSAWRYFLDGSQVPAKDAEILFQNAIEICENSGEPKLQNDLLCLEAYWDLFATRVHHKPVFSHRFEEPNILQSCFREVEFNLREVTERLYVESSLGRERRRLLDYEKRRLLIPHVGSCVKEMKRDVLTRHSDKESHLSDIVDFVLLISNDVVGWQMLMQSEALGHLLHETADLGRIESLSQYLYRDFENPFDRQVWTMTVWFGPQVTLQNSSVWNEMREKFEICVRDTSRLL